MTLEKKDDYSEEDSFCSSYTVQSYPLFINFRPNICTYNPTRNVIYIKNRKPSFERFVDRMKMSVTISSPYVFPVLGFSYLSPHLLSLSRNEPFWICSAIELLASSSLIKSPYKQRGFERTYVHMYTYIG